MDFDVLKQVINIEYVGPHQIQTTSSPSMNYTGRIDQDDVRLEYIRHGKNQTNSNDGKEYSFE